MPRKDGDASEDKLTRHGQPVRTIEDVYRRVFAPRQKPHPAPDVPIDAPDAICVIVNVKWVSHLIGVIDVLADEDMWTGDETERHRASTEIQRLVQHLMTGEACMVDPCCPETNELLEAIITLNTTIINNQVTLIEHTETVIEQNDTDIFNSIVNNYNQFVYQNYNQQQTNNYIYNGTPQSINDSLGDDFSEDDQSITDNALCRALQKYMEAQMYMASVQGNLATGATGAALAALVALAPLTLGLSIVAGLAVAGLTLAVGVWNSAMQDPVAQRKVLCELFNQLKGQPLTEENFQNLASTEVFDALSPEGRIYGQIGHSAAFYPENYQAFLRLLGEAQGQGDWRDCDCCEAIEDYNIVALNDCTVEKLTDFTYRITQTNLSPVESDPFCDDWNVFIAQFAEEQGRCIDIVSGSGTAANRHKQINCNGEEISGVGGAGGQGTWFEVVTRACPPDPTTLDITITIACPTQGFRPV